LLDRTEYTGVDLSLPILEAARERWPKQSFEFRDIRDEPYGDVYFDFCIACGVFTVKNELSCEETLALAHGVLKSAWSSVKVGLNFNCMSGHWGREDLFCWPLNHIRIFL
jgi:Methyltransferase domain